MPIEIERDWLERWLSVPRYECYLSSARNDREAFDLYLWNTSLAQAVLRDISFFEIALRNSYDAVLREGWTNESDWLLSDESPVRRTILRKNSRRKVNDINRSNRKQIDGLHAVMGKTVSHDRLVSNLTLGFWTHMTDRNHERDLWIPYIHKAWPKGVSRKDLNTSLTKINRLRNRAVHHERLFALAEDQLHPYEISAKTIELFEQLAPEAVRAIYGPDSISSTAVFVTNNPSPCDVDV